jgi:hypothetical protein
MEDNVHMFQDLLSADRTQTQTRLCAVALHSEDLIFEAWLFSFQLFEKLKRFKFLYSWFSVMK